MNNDREFDRSPEVMRFFEGCMTRISRSFCKGKSFEFTSLVFNIVEC